MKKEYSIEEFVHSEDFDEAEHGIVKFYSDRNYYGNVTVTEDELEFERRDWNPIPLFDSVKAEEEWGNINFFVLI